MTGAATVGSQPEKRERQVTMLIAVVLVCLNLRVVFGGVGPLIPFMGLHPVVASILTALPPLCMGLFSPIGGNIAARHGEERALLLSLAILTAGVIVRSSGVPGLLVGTIIASAGIAALNVLTPVFIRQRFAPQRLGVMMGIYAMMMGGGGGIMAALSVPIYHATGGSWPLALGIAAVPAIMAMVAMLPLLGTSRGRPAARVKRPWHAMMRHGTAWSIAGFFGIQCLVFYTMLAWLPAIYVSKGVAPATAGLYLALSIFGVAAGGFVGPTIAARRNDHRRELLLSIGFCVVGIVGILLAPVPGAPVWVILLGLGMGAGQGIPGVLYAKRTVDHPQMTQLSGMVQTIGYLIAATGPLAAALLHGWTGGWKWPLIALLGLLLVNGVISLPGGRAHVIAGH